MAAAAGMVTASGVGELIPQRRRHDHVAGVGTVQHALDPLQRVGILGFGQQIGVAFHGELIPAGVDVTSSPAKPHQA